MKNVNLQAIEYILIAILDNIQNENVPIYIEEQFQCYIYSELRKYKKINNYQFRLFVEYKNYDTPPTNDLTKEGLGEIDLLIAIKNGTNYEKYIIELKCKTKGEKQFKISDNLVMKIGSNTGWETGVKQICDDLRRTDYLVNNGNYDGGLEILFTDVKGYAHWENSKKIGCDDREFMRHLFYKELTTTLEYKHYPKKCYTYYVWEKEN